MKKAERKQKLINKIKAIIEECGAFSPAEIEMDSPCVNSMGNMVALAESFDKEGVDVEVYDGASSNCDSINSYSLEYEDLDIETLKEILEIAKEYENIS